MKKNRCSIIPYEGWKKLFLMVRITTVLLFVGLMQVTATVYSQKTRLNLKLEDASIEHVFKIIEDQSEFHFLYRSDVLKKAPNVSLEMKEALLEEVLDKIIVPYGFGYEIDDRVVVIKKVEEKKPLENPVAQKENKITGTVRDASGLPIPGASVFVKGTTIGTITRTDGTFELNIPENADTIVFSFVGMKKQEIALEGRTTLAVEMEEETIGIEEVVAVAYGTQSKATLTGALSTADPKELRKIPVASITNVLAGAVPGVTTVQTTGQPGADEASIYIRGVGSLSDSRSRPLILVDGVERDFSQIDPNEIENFTVLKDASSTAVFGVRGANGVVLITTRRGAVGKPRISISTNTGLQQPLSYVKQTGSYEFARFWNMKMEQDNVTTPSSYFSREDIEAFRLEADMLHTNTDWGKMMYRDFFLQTKNNINMSGGGENVRYFVSFGYLFQNGLLKSIDILPYNNNYSYDRYNYRANLDFKLSGSTTMKFDIGGNIGITQEPNYVADITNPWVYAQIWANPLSGPGIVEGKIGNIPRNTYPIEFRSGYSSFYGYGYQQEHRTTLNMTTEISQNLDFITKGLIVSVKGAYDNFFRLEKNRRGGSLESWNIYYKGMLDNPNMPWTDPDFDKTVVLVPTGSDTPLTYSESYGRDRRWYLEGRINYNQTFGDHNVGGLFLYNQSRDYYPSAYTYLPNNYIGYVGRITYSYKTKYLAEFNAGYNGSENFAPGKNRYGFFPAGSAGWIMTEENFMKSQRVINYLKLRASWGLVGNDTGVSRFMYMPTVWKDSESYSFGVDNPIAQTAAATGTPGNRNVTWETAEKLNFGLDMRTFNNRMSLGVDYFTEHRTGILITPKTFPNVISTSLPDLNLGIVDNWGYEIALGWDQTLGNGLRYYANATTSFSRNKIVFMDEVPNEYEYMNQTGGPTGRTSDVFVFERLYQHSDFITDADGKKVLNPELPQPNVIVYPGDAMYSDLNGDNIVDNNDKMTTGFPERPEYVFGFNGGLNYKGFSFNMQWTGATNVNKVFQIEYRIPYTNAGKRGLLQYFYDDCWTEENQLTATLPRAAETSEQWNSAVSTLWLRDASYLRLKTLTMGYSFSKKRFLNNLGIETVDISLSGYNLLTFSPFTISDPESQTHNWGEYPLVKVYSLGLDINF